MAKSINLVNSRVSSVCIDRDGDELRITIVGVGVDGDGNEYSVDNYVGTFDELPSNVSSSGMNFLKFLSKAFNKLVADEDSETL